MFNAKKARRLADKNAKTGKEEIEELLSREYSGTLLEIKNRAKEGYYLIKVPKLSERVAKTLSTREGFKISSVDDHYDIISWREAT